MHRLQSGESLAAVSGDTGIGQSVLAEWLAKAKPASPSAPSNGKSADITGPGISDRWGVTATDLDACVLASNGELVAVFGDTFSGRRVGEGE